MVASGYLAETVVIECFFLTLLTVASIELYRTTKPQFKARTKILQKVWFPSAWVVAVLGIIHNIDARGALGIYTQVPVELRICMMIVAAVPPFSCALVWEQQLLYAACKSFGVEGPWRIGADEKVQFKLVYAGTFIWLADAVITSILVAIFNKVQYFQLLWGWAVIVCLVSLVLSVILIKVLNKSVNNSQGNAAASRHEEAKSILLKLKFAAVMSFNMTIFCSGAIIYTALLGPDVTVDSYMFANPEVYEPSILLWFVSVGLSIGCLFIILIIGTLLEKYNTFFQDKATSVHSHPGEVQGENVLRKTTADHTPRPQTISQG
jgi:hypothetical protein